MNITIRNIPDEVLAQINAIKGPLSREEFLRRALAEIAEVGEVLQVKHTGAGLRGFTETGGTVRLVAYASSIGGSAANLTPEQFAAYQRAKLLVDPRNGGDWDRAKKVLEAAKIEMYWD